MDQPHKPIRQCPVCCHNLQQPTASQMFGPAERQWPGLKFDCVHCGNFIVDEFEFSHLVSYLNPPRSLEPIVPIPNVERLRAVMAHTLRRMAMSGTVPVLTDGMSLRILQEDRLPNLAEQKDNLLRWFGKIGEIGQLHFIDYEGLGARVGSPSPGVFQLLLQGMLAEHFLSGKLAPDGDGGQLGLTYHGFERLEQLERATPSGFNAFMAMKGGDELLNRVVDDYFRAAVKETGFNLYRLDDRPEAGLIDARLRNEIRNCRFLIADLSHANAGSYWEAGYAEGLGKPVIYTCKKSVFQGEDANITRPHFDTNHHLTIVWDEQDLPKAAQMLMDTIRFSIPEAKQKAN